MQEKQIYYTISYDTHTYIMSQVNAKEQELKHKLQPEKTFLKATGLNLPAAYPREELHQFPSL